MKTILVFLLLLTGAYQLQAQRLLSGQKGIELSTGIHSNGKAFKEQYFIKGGLVLIRTNGNYQFLYIDYSSKKYSFENDIIPVETFAAEAGYSFHIASDWRKTFSINLGLGAVGGYEQINKGDSVLSSGAVLTGKNSFVYGGTGNLSLEFYIGDRFVLLTRAQARYLLGTSMDHLRPSLGVGLRFIF
ncbi:conjugal transfer protein TraO [Elizabethkingia anophelis]|uniref:conjugal transfer protein TraO n=1 Tax=Elizabethkingia anophelis TaxID=1117645 RepID=UPI00136DE662|nr:conjugal transfer protein TraO [Elizabethkingia anophelis]MYY43963.1 conjugal transfer protein TraO [Elizabethkingia anophelis]